MLVATGLRKRYGDTVALDGFELRVEAGEIVGLVGHNGAGKTTFVEIVTGLVRPDAGRVLVDGIDVAQRPRAARALIGYAPQDIGLYLSQTVRENLRLFAGLARLRGRTQEQRIAETAEALGLSGELDRRVGLLSGGQRRRTQAATALISQPRLLLLDEPTTGADPGTRQALLGVVRQLADRGTAICYTTHYLPELADLAATIAVASNGRVIARGSQRELLAGIPAELRVTFADGSVESIHSIDPSVELKGLLGAENSLQDVDIRRPSLDDLYHSLESDRARPAAGTRESHPVSA
jgi:ABC-2 type transport system ATP-binding protein